ncbi:YcxB-like protein [Lachnospiraceae bacterium XBB1006]|nr:YcxB-like protein [Lachnospiraceae bacterium XBB1006]
MDIHVQLTEKDLFSFHMYHSYHRVQTWMFTILGMVITIAVFTTYNKVDLMYTLLYLICGLIFVFYTPLHLRTSTKMAFRGNGSLTQPMCYHLDEQGITVSLAEGETDIEEGIANSITWNLVYKVVKTKKAYYLYTTPKNASILPLSQIGQQQEALEELLKKELESFQYDN